MSQEIITQQWGRVDDDGFCAEIIDFDPTNRFYESIHFYPVQSDLTGWIDYSYQWNGETWDEPEKGYTLKKKMDSLQKQYTDAIQYRLDSFAKTRGYDSIQSASTYVNSKILKFQIEGQYAADIRDATWAACYALMALVMTGERPIPTMEEVFAELPPMVWPDIPADSTTGEDTESTDEVADE